MLAKRSKWGNRTSIQVHSRRTGVKKYLYCILSRDLLSTKLHSPDSNSYFPGETRATSVLYLVEQSPPSNFFMGVGVRREKFPRRRRKLKEVPPGQQQLLRARVATRIENGRRGGNSHPPLLFPRGGRAIKGNFFYGKRRGV